MRRSSSAAYGTPETSQSCGYIEIGVKPGIVLSSFTRNDAVGAQEEVDPRHRLAPARLERAHRERAHLGGLGVGQRRGREQLAPCRPRTCRRSRRSRRPGPPRRAATPRAGRRRARDLDLAARRPPPRRGSTRRTRARARSRRRSSARVARLRHADRRAHVRGFTKHGSPSSASTRSANASTSWPSRSVEVRAPAAARRPRTPASS